METGSSQLMQVLLLRTTLWELRMWMVYSILTESQKETHFSRVCVCCYFSRVWSTLCDPVDCNPPGSPVHGIFPARILEWVAISFSRGSSWPRDRTWVSHIASRLFYYLSHQWSSKWTKKVGKQWVFLANEDVSSTDLEPKTNSTAPPKKTGDAGDWTQDIMHAKHTLCH